MNRLRSWAPTILALIFCFFWGSAFIANKINLRYAPPLWNLTIRCTIAGLIVLAVVWWRGIRLPRSFRAYLRLAVFGLFNTALYMLCTLWGLQQISAGTAGDHCQHQPPHTRPDRTGSAQGAPDSRQAGRCGAWMHGYQLCDDDAARST